MPDADPPDPDVEVSGPVWKVRSLAPETDVEALRARARAAGARVLVVDVPADDVDLAARVEGTRVLGRYLTRTAQPAAALPPELGWRPMTADEYGPWLEAQVAGYAADNVDRTGGDESAALARSRRDFAAALPDGLATADTSLVVLLVHGERVGHLWLRHHREGAETFGYDLEVVPARRREGWGRAALALAARLAAEAGDTTLGLHVFGGNVGARRLYESAGFAVRSTSHDLLASA